MSFCLSALMLSLLSPLGFIKAIESGNETSIISGINSLIDNLSSALLIYLLFYLLTLSLLFLIGFVGFLTYKRIFQAFNGNKTTLLLILLLLIIPLVVILFWFTGTIMSKILTNKTMIDLSKLLIGFPAAGFFKLLFYGNPSLMRHS